MSFSYRPDYSSQLANAVAMAAKEDQILWTIFGVFFAAHLVTLAIAFDPDAEFQVLICAVAFLMSGVWFKIQDRALGHLAYLEHIIERLESQYLRIDPRVSISGQVNVNLHTKLVGRGARGGEGPTEPRNKALELWRAAGARSVMRGTVAGWGILWLGSVFWFSYELAYPLWR